MILQSLLNSSAVYYIFALGIMIWSIIIRARLNRLVRKYSEETVASLKDANTCVKEMLHANEIYNVEVLHTRGDMTDNYNPKQDTINLSDTTYGQNSITAVAVAAHECGHACQAHSGMALYKVRQAIAPVASITSRFSVWVVVIGVVIMYAASSIETSNMGYAISTIGIILYGAVFLFYLVTLPIERNASRRGLKAMEEFGLPASERRTAALDSLHYEGAKEKMSELLHAGLDIDGVFAGSDWLALGCYMALREHGKRIPEDVKLAGYDDISITSFNAIPITTVHQQVDEMGRLAAERLIGAMNGKQTNQDPIRVPVYLVPRKSTRG